MERRPRLQLDRSPGQARTNHQGDLVRVTAEDGRPLVVVTVPRHQAASLLQCRSDTLELVDRVGLHDERADTNVTSPDTPGRRSGDRSKDDHLGAVTPRRIDRRELLLPGEQGEAE